MKSRHAQVSRKDLRPERVLEEKGELSSGFVPIKQNRKTSKTIVIFHCHYMSLDPVGARVADVARTRERRSLKGQGLLRKEGPPTYIVGKSIFASGNMFFEAEFS